MIKKILIGLFALISYLNLDAQCTSQRVTNPTFSPITGWAKTTNARPANPGIAFNIDNSNDNIYQDLTDVNPLGNQSPIISMCIGPYDALPPSASGWARLEVWYAGTNYVNMINQAGNVNAFAYIEYVNGASGNLAQGNSLIKNTTGIEGCSNNINVTLPNNVPNNGRLEFRYYTQQDNPPANADDDFFIGNVTLTRTMSAPATPTVSTTAASCSAAGTAKIGNYNASYTYTFTPAGPTVGAGGAISGMTTGTNYTVTASLSGCQSASSSSFSIAAMVATPPQLSVTAGGPTALCTGGSVQLTATYNTTGAYQWYNNGIAIPGAIFYQYTATTAGTYTVTRELGGCTSPASAGVNVTVNVCQPDFGSCNARMFYDVVNTAGTISTLYEVNYATAPFTYTSLGTGSARNGIVYNPQDNYIYGIEWVGFDGNELIRVGSDGSSVNLGTISGLPSANYNNGGISTTGDYYVVRGNNGGGNILYDIDITTRTATPISLSQTVSVLDLAWYNGLLYGVDNSTGSNILVSINVATGVVTNVGPTGPAGSPLALWAFSNGLYSTTGSGVIYAIDPIALATGSGGITRISSAPTTSGGDGANCPTALIKLDTDLSVTKTNTPTSGANDLPNDTYIPGETRKYTVVVSNSATGFGAQNITVNDPVPAGINAATVSWKCTPTSGGAVCGAATGTGALNDTGLDLPPGAVATYEVTMTVPTTFTGALTNTVTITPPSNINDTNAANNTATDTDLVNNSTFSCNSNFYLSQYPAGGPTTLYTLNNNTNPFTITSIGTSPAGYKVNGIGYNTVDKYIYGIHNVALNDNHLIKIDATGTMTDLGTINTLPNTGYNSGTFDNAGNLYTNRYGTDKFYKINVTTKVATEIVLSRSIQANDIVYDQSTGKFFSYETGADRLISINLTSATAGTVSDLPISNLPAGSTFGAMYIDSNGDIFGNEDNTGSGFYQFDKTTGTAVKISTSIKAFGNDGANCPDAVITFPADLSVTKTDGKTSYIPGTTNTYTIVVSNASGPYGVLGATVSDLLPAGIPAANMSYSVPVLTGGATTSITGLQTGALNDVVGLPVGSTITYTVTINVPMAYTGALTNTVTVTPPASTSSDPTPGNNTATDTDAYNCGGKDSDGDGIGDICDLDDDNDGIPDCIENGFDGNPNTAFKSNSNAVAISNTNPANGPLYQFRLTNGTNQQGQAWSYGKIDFSDSFILSMRATLSDADGIAIVFHNDPAGTSASGQVGQGLGARGIANGIALELDTFTNSCNNDAANGQNCDPSYDHGSIRTTAGWIGAGKLAGDGQLGNGAVNGNNIWHDVVVYWNASIRRLSYTFDGAEVTSYIFPTSGANSIETILGGKTTATFGYTGSTGMYGNTNSIGFDNPCTIPIFFDTDGDGINDHLDLDSDNDGCVDALEGDERVTTAQLVTAGGTVVVGTGSAAANQNLCANGTCVDAQGVPKIVNAGGAADVGNDQGQGIGSSQNSAVSACNAIPCNTEYVTNGTFATNLAGWTGDTDWIYESGKAKMYSENVTNKVLSQTLHNLDRISNNTVSLTLELGTQDYNQASGGTASLDILLDGVVYATINNGTLRNSSNVTMSLYGGATSDFVTFGTSAVSGFTYKTFTLNIPYLGSSSAALTFRASAANGDDWSLDNISVVEKCSYCVKPGDFSEAGIPTKVGITSQTKLTGWPESIPNGHIALESKGRGFVITRVPHVSATPDLINDSVKDPKEGMIVYDIQDKCVKLYNGTVWNCIQRSCNN